MNEEPSPSRMQPVPGADHEIRRRNGGLRGFLRNLFGRSSDTSLRDAFEEILEEHEDDPAGADGDERTLIANILKVGEKTAYDVMVPRADIVGIEEGASLEAAVAVMTTKPHSRYPLYRENLDEATGFVHIKDVLSALHKKRRPALRRLRRDVLFVSPSIRVLDLLLQMRLTRQHMAIVVDEFGGVDGLITIEDLVEQIVGEIEDEHDVTDAPMLLRRDDGVWIADARLPLEDLEEMFGPILTEDEREEDLDTVGGLVFTLAGHVPSRGEVIPHDSGIEFEVIDADPRRLKRVRLLNTPPARDDPQDAAH